MQGNKDQTAQKLVIEQFVSKYPYKQRTMNGKDVIFRGSVKNIGNNINLALSEIKIKSDTKFVIIYIM